MMSTLSLLLLLIIIFTGALVNAIDDRCPCGQMVPRPDLWKKALTARWMAHSLDWGVLTTLSTRIHTSEVNDTAAKTITSAVPFGNVYSFIDGSCTNATGTPYFYGTYMDQSFQDMKGNPTASFTLSEASLSTACADVSATDYVQGACVITPQYTISNNDTDNFPGDPESPICARLTMTGTLLEIIEGTEEYMFAANSFFQRHPQMKFWPSNHEWKIVKLVVTDLWLIDYFGGATILTPTQYYENDLIKLSLNGY